MRRGSLTERYVKCNKAGCPCGDSEDDRHGPYYSVSRVVKGRTQSRWLDAAHAQFAGRSSMVSNSVRTWRRIGRLVNGGRMPSLNSRRRLPKRPLKKRAPNGNPSRAKPRSARTLRTLPARGRVVPELADLEITAYLELSVPPYRIIYRTEKSKVFVHAVLDDRRDLRELLAERLLRSR